MANFSDDNKIFKHKFYESHILTITNDKFPHWELTTPIQEYHSKGYAGFNWSNIICSKCNNEYGCIIVNYNYTNKNTISIMNKSMRNNMHRNIPEYKNKINIYETMNINEKTLKRLTLHYCIGCFMSNHKRTK